MNNEKINEAEFWKARFKHANSMYESCMKTLETLMSKTKSKDEWVGLTDEDMYELRREGHHHLSERDFRSIEAKLKEKNHG